MNAQLHYISPGVYAWTVGEWGGVVYLPDDERAAARFEWNDSEPPENYEEIEDAVLEVVW